ncbi:peptidoglycan DD-metalloendopeptidase family protein [Malikia sp.]|uniref:peptidoglycan DD-metalloendopeptidase family protein n=1 Tax=Malikia sp. TaxID=2070706 RepID=UPI00260F9FC9|nr:peptidoglycan DD-metalloendopeptidase family protein [Malikia sp.]MDD2728469.1 peptidoglycan DD-metalloendopeptidase family protein [Malikia sp.]
MARWPLQLALAAGLSLLAACTTTSLDQHAPVTDRSSGSASSSVSQAASLPPGQENAGKPGYYIVRPGDTLTRIGLDSGQSPRDLARWNALENPNLIEVGQVLRVVPPLKEPAVPAPGVVAVAPAADARVKPRPLNGKGTEPAAKSASAEPVARSAAASAPANGEELGFSWPNSGALLDRFDETRNKGVDIAGKAGDPVLAAADGRVVYAGSGLRGYGNLIILKHNNTYLTAYAHNQILLVKEDQNVRQGQKIAEMGSSDADRVKLHFEVRRQGKPVDPLKYLPSR